MKMIMFCVILMMCGLWAKAQNNIANTGGFNLASFFEGHWAGDGEFGNGKKIKAAVTFKISLDSCWLVCTHEDEPPNRYKAISMWSIDKTKKLIIAYVFDNFHGHRLFTGNCESNALVLVHSDTTTAKVIIHERFNYTMTDGTHFKMSYETSKNGVSWILGDALNFVKLPD